MFQHLLKPSHYEIQRKAYEISESSNFSGDPKVDWSEAEKELIKLGKFYWLYKNLLYSLKNIYLYCFRLTGLKDKTLIDIIPLIVTLLSIVITYKTIQNQIFQYNNQYKKEEVKKYLTDLPDLLDTSCSEKQIITRKLAHARTLNILELLKDEETIRSSLLKSLGESKLINSQIKIDNNFKMRVLDKITLKELKKLNEQIPNNIKLKELKNLKIEQSENKILEKFKQINIQFFEDVTFSQLISNLQCFMDNPLNLSSNNFDSNTILSLQGVNLKKANLSNFDLSGANLSEADLSEANLSGSDLSNANLSGAILSNANLSQAYLGGTLLRYTNLEKAQLKGANLSYADLREANLTSADLGRSTMLNANFSGANLENAILKFANLRKIENLTVQQLNSAKDFTQAIYDETFLSKKDNLISQINQEKINNILKEKNIKFSEFSCGEYTHTYMAKKDNITLGVRCLIIQKNFNKVQDLVPELVWYGEGTLINKDDDKEYHYDYRSMGVGFLNKNKSNLKNSSSRLSSECYLVEKWSKKPKNMCDEKEKTRLDKQRYKYLNTDNFTITSSKEKSKEEIPKTIIFEGDLSEKWELVDKSEKFGETFSLQPQLDHCGSDKLQEYRVSTLSPRRAAKSHHLDWGVRCILKSKLTNQNNKVIAWFGTGVWEDRIYYHLGMSSPNKNYGSADLCNFQENSFCLKANDGTLILTPFKKGSLQGFDVKQAWSEKWRL